MPCCGQGAWPRGAWSDGRGRGVPYTLSNNFLWQIVKLLMLGLL